MTHSKTSWFSRYNFEIQRVLAFPEHAVIILILSFLSSFSIFMILPYLTVYLVDSADLAVSDAALILGVSVWVQRAGGLMGGLACDRFGASRTLTLGLALRVPAYGILGFSSSFANLMLAGILLGAGSALYMPSAKSALVAVVSPEECASALASRNVCANAGVALGPLAGALVFGESSKALFLGVMAVFAMLTVGSAKLKIRNRDQIATCRTGDMWALVKGRTAQVLYFVSFLYFFFYIQLEVLAPVYARSLVGMLGPSLVFLINALVVIFAQPLIVSSISARSRECVFSAGFFLMAASFAMIAVAHVFAPLIIVGIVLLSLAEVVLSLRIDIEATSISPRHVGVMFGLLGVSSAFGGLSGSWLGGAFYEHFLAGQQQFATWAALAGLGLLAAAWQLCLMKHQILPFRRSK